MNRDRGPLNGSFAGGAAIALAVAAFAAFLFMPFSIERYCSEGETVASCFREWSMMVAGWAAALVGIGAAFFVWRTITKMHEQLEEMKRQTRFTVGDDLPTAEIIRSDISEGGTFRIVNWNKRTFFVIGMKWIVPGVQRKEQYVGVTWRDGTTIQITVGANGLAKGPLEVRGWENRSEGPKSAIVALPIEIDDDFRFTDEFTGTREGRIEIMGYLSGAKWKPIFVEAHGPLTDLLPKIHQIVHEAQSQS